MGPHDVERHEGSEVVCRCGERFTDEGDHLVHFWLEKSRAALRGEDG